MCDRTVEIGIWVCWETAAANFAKGLVESCSSTGKSSVTELGIEKLLLGTYSVQVVASFDEKKKYFDENG